MAIIDVIKYEGNKDVLVFKHPTVDFNTKAKLIVHEKQEAIVFMNGRAALSYPTPGRYTLESENLPGIKHFAALVSGGELANHCEVYFFNKLNFQNIPWVTSAMDLQDPVIKNYFAFLAQGYYDVSIQKPMDLFKMIGNDDYLKVSDLKVYFAEKISSRVKEVISNFMVSDRISYGEINSHLTSLSEKAEVRIRGIFEQVGLALDSFRVEAVNILKDKEYEIHRQHMGERSGQRIEGYRYVERRTLDAMEKQAENQAGSGAAASMAAGTGLGLGMGQAYNGIMRDAMSMTYNNGCGGGMGQSVADPEEGIVHAHCLDENKCPQCGKGVEKEWVHCPFCGQVLQAEKRTCPKCRCVLPPDGDFGFCPNCGMKLK